MVPTYGIVVSVVGGNGGSMASKIFCPEELVKALLSHVGYYLIGLRTCVRALIYLNIPVSIFHTT